VNFLLELFEIKLWVGGMIISGLVLLFVLLVLLSVLLVLVVCSVVMELVMDAVSLVQDFLFLISGKSLGSNKYCRVIL